MVRKLDPKLSRLRSKNETDVVFTVYDLELIKEQQVRKDEYAFTGRFSPSKLELTFDMCPHEFVRVTCQEFKMADSAGAQRMDLGRALHDMVLGRIAKTEKVYDGVLYPPEILAANTRKDWEAERLKVWPSFPVFSANGMWSGEVDIALVIKEEPTIIDLKFPQIKDVADWEYKLSKYPDETYMAQVCIYGELCNRYGLTKDKIKRLGVSYRNYFVHIPKNYNKSVRDSMECYFDYDTTMENKTCKLMDALEEELTRFNANIDKGCMYSGCKKHDNSAVR